MLDDASQLQAVWVEQEVEQPYGDNAVFVVDWVHDVFYHHNFLERVANTEKRCLLLRALVFVGKRIRRLDIVAPSGKICYKVDLEPLFAIATTATLGSVFHHANIY